MENPILSFRVNNNNEFEYKNIEIRKKMNTIIKLLRIKQKERNLYGFI